MRFSRNRLVVSIICNNDCEIAESFASMMTSRGHYVRVYNEAATTRAMCHGCFTIESIPSQTIVVCFRGINETDYFTIREKSIVVVQICLREASKRINNVWNSKASFYYYLGMEELISRHEETIIPFTYHGALVESNKSKILVYGDKLGLEDEHPFDFDLLKDAKVVVINSKQIILDNFRGFHALKVLSSGIPMIVYSLTELDEFVEDGISGFLVNSRKEIIESLNRIDELDVKINEKFSPARVCELYEDYFSGLLDLNNEKLGYIDNFIVGETMDGYREGLNFLMDSEYIWMPKRSEKLEDYWMISNGVPFKKDSISRLIEAFEITQIDTLSIGSFSSDEAVLVAEDLKESDVKPLNIVFSEEQNSHDLEQLGYHRISDRVFILPQKKLIGFDLRYTRIARALSDLNIGDDFIFEIFEKSKAKDYFRYISSDMSASEIIESKRLSPKKIYGIDLKSFPRKFHPKTLKTVGLIAKPQFKVIGKMINGKLCPSESSNPLDGIVSVIRKFGLELRYIDPEISKEKFDVTFELYRHIDLLICHEKSQLHQCAIEAACCGVPVIVTGRHELPEVFSFESENDLEECIVKLLNQQNFEGYRDLIYSKVSSKFDINRSDLCFLK